MTTNHRDPVDKAITEAGTGCLTFLVGLLIAIVGESLARSNLRAKFRGGGVVVGRDGGSKISIPYKDRMKHAHIMGATGSGKTTLLFNMAKQDMDVVLNDEPFYGVGVIDPKGDLVDRLLPHVPRHRRKDVIVFDPTDSEKPLGFNILEDVPDNLRSRTTSEVVAIFKKLFAYSWGPRLEHILRYAVLALLEIPGSTLADVPTLLLDKEFRRGVLPHVSNWQVLNFWQTEYPALAKSRDFIMVVQPILNKVGPWLAYPEVSNIIDQTQSSFNLRHIMDQRKIFLARLPEGLLGEDTRQILGSLLITRFQLAAASRAAIPERARKPFVLYVDEFQNFVTEASGKIVTEGRSFGLGLVVANQHEGQFRDQPGLLEDLQRNVAAHLFTYRDGDKYRLEYVRLQDWAGADGEPPIIHLDPLPALPAGDSTVAAEIIEESRERYGRDRDWVENDSQRRRFRGASSGGKGKRSRGKGNVPPAYA